MLVHLLHIPMSQLFHILLRQVVHTHLLLAVHLPLAVQPLIPLMLLRGVLLGPTHLLLRMVLLLLIRMVLLVPTLLLLRMVMVLSRMALPLHLERILCTTLELLTRALLLVSKLLHLLINPCILIYMQTLRPNHNHSNRHHLVTDCRRRVRNLLLVRPQLHSRSSLLLLLSPCPVDLLRISPFLAVFLLHSPCLLFLFPTSLFPSPQIHARKMMKTS